MRKARNNWQEICAVLAILLGLVLAGVSWADGGIVWNQNTGPTSTEFMCNKSTSNKDCTNNFLNTTPLLCMMKGKGSNLTLYTCPGGNTIWNSIKATAIRSYGTCGELSGSCVSWSQYWCVAWNVYEDNSCSDYACDMQGYSSGFCDPTDPTGQ